jgi:DNA-binding protein HU-beta
LHFKETDFTSTSIISISEMTKADIISEITEQTGLQKKEVAVVIESFMETVKKNMLEKRENVYLRGFGSFIIKRRAEKTARDIGKNTTITIPAHDFPSFKPAKAFADKMKGE